MDFSPPAHSPHPLTDVLRSPTMTHVTRAASAGNARPSVSYPFDSPPTPGSTLEVAPGVQWIRMPLPFSLNHINVWTIADGDGWAIVDTEARTDAATALWRRLCTESSSSRPVTRFRHARAPRSRGYGRLAYAYFRLPSVDDAPRIPELPRGRLGHGPRSTQRRRGLLLARYLLAPSANRICRNSVSPQAKVWHV